MKKPTAALLAFVVALAGCQKTPPTTEEVALVHKESKKSVYHWKTTFNPTKRELQFMKDHQVSRLYIKFFDVSMDGVPQEPVPVATTKFLQPVDTTLEIVPVVFITVPAMRAIASKNELIVQKLVQRIEAMCKANHIGHVKEVQLDCDWTESTKEAYYHFCKTVGDLLHARGMDLSSTIRLHQLRQEPPPVDRGVLMIYNTGPIQNPQTKNSIIDYNDVKPYLQNVNYKLPLEFAYPTFSWTLVFDRGDNFQMILRQHIEPNDSTILQERGNTLRIKASDAIPGITVMPGSWLREESAPYSEIMRVKELVEQAFSDSTNSFSNIIYHLDSLNLSHYTDEEIDSILN